LAQPKPRVFLSYNLVKHRKTTADKNRRARATEAGKEGSALGGRGEPGSSHNAYEPGRRTSRSAPVFARF
jgi:hypothetical protein